MPSINTISPGWLDVQAYAGDTFRLQLAFFQADNVTPLNLTGITWKMSIKLALMVGGTSLQDFTTSAGIVLSGASNNILTISGLLLVKGGDYYYDLEATNADTTVVSYLRGQFCVDQDITNSGIEH